MRPHPRGWVTLERSTCRKGLNLWFKPFFFGADSVTPQAKPFRGLGSGVQLTVNVSVAVVLAVPAVGVAEVAK